MAGTTFDRLTNRNLFFSHSHFFLLHRVFAAHAFSFFQPKVLTHFFVIHIDIFLRSRILAADADILIKQVDLNSNSLHNILTLFSDRLLS